MSRIFKGTCVYTCKRSSHCHLSRREIFLSIYAAREINVHVSPTRKWTDGLVIVSLKQLRTFSRVSALPLLAPIYPRSYLSISTYFAHALNTRRMPHICVCVILMIKRAIYLFAPLMRGAERCGESLCHLGSCRLLSKQLTWPDHPRAYFRTWCFAVPFHIRSTLAPDFPALTRYATLHDVTRVRTSVYVCVYMLRPESCWLRLIDMTMLR